MRIGIDIDGVLTESVRFIIDYGTKFCIENNLTYKIKQDKYDASKVLGISKENEIKFWNNYLKKYILESSPRYLSKEVIDKLKESGCEIYIVTARNEWGLPKKDYGEMKNFTEQWFKENKIYYDKIIFTEGSKLPYCIGNYIDIMIEDEPKHIKEISKKIPVICYNNTYNETTSGKNIIRAYSWYDIYKIIDNKKQAK